MEDTLYIVSRNKAPLGEETGGTGCWCEHNILTQDGKFLLEKWALGVRRCHCGLFIVHQYSGGDRLLTPQGEDLVPFQASSITCETPGAIIGKDRHGFDKVVGYDAGEAVFRVRRTEDNLVNLISGKGEILLPDWYVSIDDTKRLLKDRFLKVTVPEGITFLDWTTGKPICPETFEKDRFDWDRHYDEDYLCGVKHRGRWKVLTTKGEVKAL